MEVTSIPTSTGPFVIDSNSHDNHGNHRNDTDWPERTSERVKNDLNARFFEFQGQVASQFAEGQTAVAAVSKDVAVLSRDVVISEGRTAVAIGTVTKDVALLGRDLALTEARLQLVMAQNAAAMAECCCETKALVISQNGATRDLIQGNKILELEAKLAASNAANAALLRK